MSVNMCDGGHEFVNVQLCVRVHLFVIIDAL